MKSGMILLVLQQSMKRGEVWRVRGQLFDFSKSTTSNHPVHRVIVLHKFLRVKLNNNF